MQHPVPSDVVFSSATVVTPPSRARHLVFVAAGVALAVLLAALAAAFVHVGFASAVVPFTLTADEGHIPEETTATLDDDVPAITRLDPALHDALRQAAQAAAADGVTFRVTSGWRSEGYQRWLLAEAVERYGSEEEARRFVATPDRSQHVTGDAVDIVPFDAQAWLIDHGSRFGICQTYANERWHFELATSPGGVCPTMRTDASA